MSDLLKNGIYIIENVNNKKVYIGSTIVTIGKRFKQHIAKLKLNKHSSKGLQTDFNEVGTSGFTYTMLEEVNDFSKIRDIERYWIETIQPEYNVKFSIGKAINYTEEIRNKMSLSHGSNPFEVYKDDKLIGTYGCQSVAARDLNIPAVDLGRVLNGKSKSVYGYRLKFVGEDYRYISKVVVKKIKTKSNRKLDGYKKLGKKRKDSILSGKYKMPLMEPSREVKLNHSRGIYKGILTVTKDGVIIGKYLSLLEASEGLGLKGSSITNCTKGHRKTLFGYTFHKQDITKEQIKESKFEDNKRDI